MKKPARSGKGKSGKGLLTNDKGYCYGIDGTNKQLVQIGNVGNSNSEATRVYDPAGISKTIKFGGGQGAKTGLYLVTTTGQGGKLQKRDLDNVPPLRAKDRADIRLTSSSNIRRLTPLECCKLQGYNEVFEQDIDKCYTKYAKDENGNIIEVPETHQYKIIGNGVTSELVKIIFNKMKRLIDEK